MKYKIAAVIGIIATFGLFVVASAKAAPFDAQAENAYRIAVAYWGGEPTNCTSIDREIVAAGSLPSADGDQTNGYATIPTEPMPCVLRVVRVNGFPGVECDTMIHEVGHLEGHDHTTDPTNVMTHDRTTMVPVCWAMQRRYEISERLTEQRRLCQRTRTTRCRATMRGLRAKLAAL